MNDRASGNFEKSIACRKHYHMQWAHFCRKCHISFSFSFSIYSISICNFRPFHELTFQGMPSKRRSNKFEKNKPSKIVFFQLFFVLLGIVFSLLRVFEMYPVFLRVILGWYSLFMFHFWFKKNKLLLMCRA